MPLPAAFSAPNEGATPDGKWWRAFGDAELERRVERALRQNFGLRIAWERLREARALVAAVAGARLPQVDGLLEGAYAKTDASSTRSWELGLAASYELDLWGRIGQAVEAETWRAETTFLDHQAAAQSLAAAVATTWFRWIEADQQRRLLRVQLDANQRALTSLGNRFAGGLVRSADLLRQRQLVEDTREEIVAVEARMDILRSALAVLEGVPPQSADQQSAEQQSADRARAHGLPAVPPMPGTGVPSELVQRRPDLRASLASVRAAQADLAVAMTARYPRLSLGASLTTAASSPSELFDDWIRRVLGELVAPLFAGGSLEADVRRQETVVRARVLDYGRTVLEAFREVEDALVRERSQAAIIESLALQADLSESAHERLRIEYLNGVSGFLDMLSALVEAQRLQRDLLEARRLLLEYRVGLYRALAGDFEADRELLHSWYDAP